MNTVLFEADANELGEMSLAETIAWLQGLAANQPCPPEEITFEIEQWGDQWDGYGIASVKVYREETAEEATARAVAEAKQQAELEASRAASERAAYEHLKAKFG